MSQNVAPSSSEVNGERVSQQSLNLPPKSTSDQSNNGKDSHSVSKRLQHELMTLMIDRAEGISAFPDGDNLFKWIGTIVGPDGTYYEKLSYKLSLEFPSSYPYSAPNVKFISPLFHPNVDLHGNICLDILKEKWSASYDVKSILLSIQSLLGEPNNDSPLNLLAAESWSNKALFVSHMKKHENKQ